MASPHQGWRVQATSTPSHAVVVDAWQLLDLEPSSPTRSRIDLIAERLEPDGRLYLAVTGVPEAWPARPVTPYGWSPIAMVHVPAAVTVVLPSMICGLPAQITSVVRDITTR